MKNNLMLKNICLNSSNDNFVGISFEENEKRIIFPLGYEIPDDSNECRLSILNLLRLISMSKNNLFGNKYGS